LKKIKKKKMNFDSIVQDFLPIFLELLDEAYDRNLDFNSDDGQYFIIEKLRYPEIASWLHSFNKTADHFKSISWSVYTEFIDRLLVKVADHVKLDDLKQRNSYIMITLPTLLNVSGETINKIIEKHIWNGTFDNICNILPNV
jgi:hypothetical protein